MRESIQRVLVHCPETGESVGAVLRLKPSAFAALNGEYRFRCPRCGEVHAWTREDAWLEPLAQR